MIHLKTPKEIRMMQKGGTILHDLLEYLLHISKPGVTTNFLEKESRAFIRKHGAETSFDKVPGYTWSICTPVNEQIVHTPPSDYVLKDGDVLTIDAGVYLDGYHTDHAGTIIVGSKRDPKTVAFLEAGEKALNVAIEKAIKGNHIGDISKAMQGEIEGHGYFVVKPLTGHGIGRSLHEDPMVPGFLPEPIENTPRIVPGMVIAVEAIYGMGTGEMIREKGNKWSINTADGSLAAQFERTLAITDTNTLILT